MPGAALTSSPGKYFASDDAQRDYNGDIWLLGSIDDVMNISGRRLSTTEVEHGLARHPLVTVVSSSVPQTTPRADAASLHVPWRHGTAGSDTSSPAVKVSWCW
jgi:acetyl-CoA synthetase